MKHVLWAVRYAAVILVVGVPLAIPVIVFRNDQILDDDETIEQRQYRQLVFYLFAWLLTCWLGFWASDALGLALPYIFRFVARYVNPAHQRYWRVMRVMRRPITIIGTVITAYISFTFLINLNDLLVVNFTEHADPDTFGWDDAIDDVLEQCTLWASFYLLEKIMIVYITVHYHYRSNLTRIEHSKDMHNALMTLYDASVYLYPPGRGQFEDEDLIIRNATGAEHGEHRVRATSYLSRLGIDSYGMTSFFGNFMTSGAATKSHWLRPASTYAIVERALANPKSAAALAKRIWMSLVVVGQKSLRKEDIAEVLGPFRREEAERIFKVLDENESGDIQLDEMVWTVVEAGRIRHAIFQNMHDIDHCINTFDWVALTMLAVVMVFFILVLYVPTIKTIQQTASLIIVGLSFAVGRTFNHFLTGCVFVFFDHPFDIGDRVEVFNRQATQSISLIVKRQSLLYTVFRRIDNFSDIQIANEQLSQKRIENVTRSGFNRQSIFMLIDFRTSFQDLMSLRKELEGFLKHPDNKRDYQPGLALSIVNVHELNRMELKCAFNHKSNWSNEPLRAARSMKFMCKLVSAIRRIQVGSPPPIGDERRPNYTVMMSDGEQNRKRQAEHVDDDDQTAEETGSVGKDQETKPVDLVYDMSGVQRGVQDPEKTRAHLEESERQARKAAREEAELAAEADAMAGLTKIPAVPPTNKSKHEAMSTGVDIDHYIAGSSTGLRTKSNSGVENMFHR
ncbi:hypothetical protein BR93DRAFT_887864 [Coniochaeta sp. PMI_546]|nr:hypothetical protein BR93DRAFT_887864 [Coniochaeta sp. PMI_546]